MSSFLNVCLQIPNLGTIGFILIFIFLLPTILINSGAHQIFKIYTSFVVMFASVLTQAGKPNSFQNLYQLDPKKPIPFIISNLINLFGVIGILWFSISTALKHRNLNLGVAIGIILFVVTFPVARDLIPFLIEESDDVLKRKTNFNFSNNWHKYFIGLVTVIILLLLQYLLVDILVGNIGSLSFGISSNSNSRNNSNKTN